MLSIFCKSNQCAAAEYKLLLVVSATPLSPPYNYKSASSLGGYTPKDTSALKYEGTGIMGEKIVALEDDLQ